MLLIPVVVLTLTHRYNTVRGHKTGFNNSGVEDYLRRKTQKNGRYKVTGTMGIALTEIDPLGRTE